MAASGCLGHSFSNGGEAHRPIGFLGNQALVGQSLKDASDGDVAHVHSLGQILDAAGGLSRKDVLNGFHVVLSRLRGVIRPGLGKLIGTAAHWMTLRLTIIPSKCNMCYMKFSQCYKLCSIVVLLGSLLGIPEAVSATQTTEPELTIVTTTGMVGDVVQAVAGDRAKVVSIMGEGVDPHLYNPKASDVRLILGADVVFYSGLMLEGRMGDAFQKVRDRGRPVHAVTEGMPKAMLLEDEEHPGDPDPHIWMDIEAWASTIALVTRVLCEADPGGCDVYRANAKKARASLMQLHLEVKGMIQSIPENQRVLVTAHDAFRYFGRAYGIEVRGVQGISTESEAGLADLNELVDFLVERRIPVVFIESSVSPKSVQALVEGARARGHEVVIGGELYSDAMGKPGTPEGTYVGMLKHNARTLATSLGGSVDSASKGTPSRKGTDSPVQQ